MKHLLLVISLLSFGCGGPTYYVMRNPRTDQMAQCQGFSHYRRRAARNAEYCARSYEQHGYERIPRL